MAAPATRRMVVKVAGSIRSASSAIRHSRGFAASASIAIAVRVRVRQSVPGECGVGIVSTRTVHAINQVLVKLRHAQPGLARQRPDREHPIVSEFDSGLT